MMDIRNVHNLAPLRKLDHNYGGPPLRKFGDRDVRGGSQARSGRARADRSRGLGRTFKSLLARVADHFSLAASRSARRFNRAHEAYSREADRLLDELATKGSAIDPAKLLDRLERLRTQADEMAKHIALQGPDGQKIDRDAATSMGTDRLKELSGSQARALRRELLAARVDVALKTLQEDSSKYGKLKKAFNDIDWEEVERGLESEREEQFANVQEAHDKGREKYRVTLDAEYRMGAVVLGSKEDVNDLRTLRDLVVTSEAPDDAYEDIEEEVDGILHALGEETSHRGLQGLGEQLDAFGRMRNVPSYALERVFRDGVAALNRDTAKRLHEKLTEKVKDTEFSTTDLAFAAWFPESGKNKLNNIAKGVHDYGLDNFPVDDGIVDDESVEDELANLRQDLKSFLTLWEILGERAMSTGVEPSGWEEEFRDRVVGAREDAAAAPPVSTSSTPAAPIPADSED